MAGLKEKVAQLQLTTFERTILYREYNGINACYMYPSHVLDHDHVYDLDLLNDVESYEWLMAQKESFSVLYR